MKTRAFFLLLSLGTLLAITIAAVPSKTVVAAICYDQQHPNGYPCPDDPVRKKKPTQPPPPTKTPSPQPTDAPQAAETPDSAQLALMCTGAGFIPNAGNPNGGDAGNPNPAPPAPNVPPAPSLFGGMSLLGILIGLLTGILIGLLVPAVLRGGIIAINRVNDDGHSAPGELLPAVNKLAPPPPGSVGSADQFQKSGDSSDRAEFTSPESKTLSAELANDDYENIFQNDKGSQFQKVVGDQFIKFHDAGDQFQKNVGDQFQNDVGSQFQKSLDAGNQFQKTQNAGDQFIKNASDQFKKHKGSSGDAEIGGGHG
jgi:hypothetical protein